MSFRILFSLVVFLTTYVHSEVNMNYLDFEDDFSYTNSDKDQFLSNDMSNKVLNGKKDIKGLFKSTVSIHRFNSIIPICTGTIISTDAVLTAAHCIRRRRRFKFFRKIFGKYNKYNPKTLSINHYGKDYRKIRPIKVIAPDKKIYRGKERFSIDSAILKFKAGTFRARDVVKINNNIIEDEASILIHIGHGMTHLGMFATTVNTRRYGLSILYRDRGKYERIYRNIDGNNNHLYSSKVSLDYTEMPTGIYSTTASGDSGSGWFRVTGRGIPTSDQIMNATEEERIDLLNEVLKLIKKEGSSFHKRLEIIAIHVTGIIWKDKAGNPTHRAIYGAAVAGDYIQWLIEEYGLE